MSANLSIKKSLSFCLNKENDLWMEMEYFSLSCHTLKMGLPNILQFENCHLFTICVIWHVIFFQIVLDFKSITAF